MNRFLRQVAAAVLSVSLIGLAGCAAPAGNAPSASPTTAVPTTPAPTPSQPAGPLTSQDEDALAQLADVAPRTSTIDPTLADWTECWVPSEHLIPAEEVGNASTWKVLCRIHWHQKDGTKRYQDTTCIGDFAAQPMLDHCYRWVYYDYEPVFEDAPAVRASA
ncbi:hypothetical protein [Naasia aerilata]|uniref:Uncharacterized protein n=1 Tax=Naasia aerilata TaxID=1162966 RepID=A0ABN6XQR3_9MICO|nr:hypothetical protein [Naasia aerilata]BDZ47196.1 hypothetical protein GCM10025866_31050 [Naasia aerilata]